MKILYSILFVLIPSVSFGCTCFYRPLGEIIESDKKRPENSRNLYIKAKILGRNTSVYGLPYAVNSTNVQILEYWHYKEIGFDSDTLTIFDDVPCGSEFEKDSVHLIIATLDYDIYRTSGCLGNERFTSYGEDINLLGKSFEIQVFKNSKPDLGQKTEEHSLGASKIIILLSVLLNVVLALTLLKRKNPAPNIV
jgi:hypothetical protein